MGYYKYLGKGYDSFAELREAVQNEPTEKPAYYFDGLIKRKISIKPKSSTLNYMK